MLLIKKISTYKVMNKYIIRIVLSTLLALPLVTSCDLDQMPVGTLENGQSWETFERAEKQYVGLQSYMRAVSGGSNAYVTDIQADLFNARQGATSLTKVHNWTFTAADGIGDGIWGNNFAMVKQAHEILSHIDAFDVKEPTTGSEAMQKAKVSFFKAESYFAIAWAYSNMIVRFCKDYEPSTAASTLGLPLVYKEDDVTTKPSRATLAETDTFIVNRIDSAYKYLVLTEEIQDEYSNLIGSSLTTINVDGITGSNYSSEAGEAGRHALMALEARYCLYSHRYDRAIELAKELIDMYSLGTSANEMQYLWVLDQGDEIIFQPTQTQDELITSYGTVWVSYDIRSSAAEGTQLFGCNPYFFPTQGLMDLYEDGDLRKDMYFTNVYYSALPCSAQGDTQETGSQFWKFPGNQNLWKNDYDWYSKIYNMSKAFRSAEDYLIVAEASLHKDSPDEAQALEYLNMLREARGASMLSSTGEQLEEDMEDEWTREFVGEGFRLDCLKRWHKGFKRMKAQEFSTNMLITTSGYQDIEVDADDIRFVWEIPQQDTQSNPNIQKNWTSQ